MELQIQSNIFTPFGNENLFSGNIKYGSGVSRKIDKFSLKNESLSYLSQKLKIQYSSKDGDAVSFNYESKEILEANFKIEGDFREDEMKDIPKFVKKEVSRMKKVQINQFLKKTGFSVTETDGMEKKKEFLNIDEYWNAENTSQRIVDFATSFFSMFEGNNDEYLQKIKDAITDGFNQAKEIFGDLPEQVSYLVNSTHNMVVDKLQLWFSDIENHDSVQKITTEQEA